MSKSTLPATRPPSARLLTAKEFKQLKDVPPKAESFANIESPDTWGMYQIAVREFMRLTGIRKPEVDPRLCEHELSTKPGQLQYAGIVPQRVVYES